MRRNPQLRFHSITQLYLCLLGILILMSAVYLTKTRCYVFLNYNHPSQFTKWTLKNPSFGKLKVKRTCRALLLIVFIQRHTSRLLFYNLGP